MENAGEIMADDELPGLEPGSDTVAKLRERIEINEQRETLTAAQCRLLDQSAVIFAAPATKQDAAYLPRELVQVTLPHKNPGNVPVWTRSNGNLTVGIQPGAQKRLAPNSSSCFGFFLRVVRGLNEPSSNRSIACCSSGRTITATTGPTISGVTSLPSWPAQVRL